MRGGGGTESAATQGLGRTVLVIAGGPELAVALRDRLDRAYVTVCEDRAGGGDRASRSRPWMVVGDSAAVPETVVELLSRHPCLVLWNGLQAAGLPAHTRAFARFADLVAAIQGALRAQVAGMRLAPGDGLTMPDAEHAANPVLEVLVASHPHPVFAPAHCFRHVGATLAAHGVGTRLERTASRGACLVGERA